MAKIIQGQLTEEQKFMAMFNGIPSESVERALSSFTPEQRWLYCGKKYLASRWALRYEPNSKYSFLQRVDLDEVRKKALASA